MRSALKFLGIVSFVMSLASCGGGGSGGDASATREAATPSVWYTYRSPPLPLFHEVTIQPQVAGYDMSTVQCSVAGGDVPPGMSLRSIGCVLAGQPSQAGSYVLNIYASAGGDAPFTVGVMATINVEGPSLSYSDEREIQLSIGDVVDAAPHLVGWSVPPDVPVTWHYEVVGGELPTGLSLDAASGRIEGMVQVPEREPFTAIIWVKMATPYGTYPVGIAYSGVVGLPSLRYPPEAVAYISQPYVLAPDLKGLVAAELSIGGVSLWTPLPPGLSLDPATGQISGVPTGLPDVGSYGMDVTFKQADGSALQSSASISLFVVPPVTLSYGPSAIVVDRGVPFAVAPVLTARSPVALEPGATRTFTLTPGACTTSERVGVHPFTGVVSGVFDTTADARCLVDISTTNNGVTWKDTAESSFVVNP